MAKEIIFKAEAYDDLEKISEYYFRISEDLRIRFETELFNLLERLVINPVSFKLYKRNYRTITLDIFPFMVFYKEEESMIIIVAIVHKRRGERFIKAKLA